LKSNVVNFFLDTEERGIFKRETVMVWLLVESVLKNPSVAHHESVIEKVRVLNNGSTRESFAHLQQILESGDEDKKNVTGICSLCYISAPSSTSFDYEEGHTGL
jgi:hypothetical protein